MSLLEDMELKKYEIWVRIAYMLNNGEFCCIPEMDKDLAYIFPPGELDSTYTKEFNNLTRGDLWSFMCTNGRNKNQ